VVESSTYFEGDTIDIVFATVAANPQHNGWYGSEFKADAFYISIGSRHLFEIDIFFEGGRETTRVYLERSPNQTYSGPPKGLGHVATMIVLPEHENAFDSEWIRESRAACEGKLRPYEAEPSHGFGRFGFR
jgi:hypothetical protein